jgi:hypothetical protein
LVCVATMSAVEVKRASLWTHNILGKSGAPRAA